MQPPSATGSSPHRTRTQAERRGATRAKIISGALDALSAAGYTQMRLGDVARSAAVSTGALSHHFPQKTDLALAAVEEGERRVLTRLRRLVTDAQAAPDRDGRILDALYEVHAGAEFQAFLSVQAHARSHAELGPRMNTIIRRATREMGEIAADGWGPEILNAAGYSNLIALTLATVRGLIVIAGVQEPGDTGTDAWPSGRVVWPEGRSLLLELLGEIRAQTVG